MKKTFLLACCLLGLASADTMAAMSKRVVMITQIVEHPALNAVREGVIKYLREHGYADADLQIVYENAQGSPAIAAQIAQKFSGENPDAIVAISTPSAQAVAQAVRGRVPIVFAALTDPMEAKLIKDPSEPSGNITGVTDKAPFAQQIAFIKKVVPHMTKLGFLYNPGEVNSVTALKLVTKIAKDLGLELVPQAVNRTSKVGVSTQALVGKVQAVYIPNDNTVASGLEAAVKVGNSESLPLFAADILLVERGLVGMIGFDYADQGRQAGAMVDRILNGEATRSIPVEDPQILHTYLNKDAAEKMGVTLPQELLKDANKVYDGTPPLPKADKEKKEN